MEALTGLAGLAIAFCVLAAILLYILIHSKINVFIKLGLITAVVWYSLVLVNTPDKLLGWPTTNPIPPNTIILALNFDSPDPGEDNGGIYLLGVTKIMDAELPSLKSQLSWKRVFMFDTSNTPRLYRLPYTDENYAYLFSLWEEAKARQFFLMYRGGGMGDASNEGERGLRGMGLFEVINPSKFMPKDENPK
jgi:hypothetical protein